MKNVAKEVQSKIRELIDTRNQTATDLLEKIVDPFRDPDGWTRSI